MTGSFGWALFSFVILIFFLFIFRSFYHVAQELGLLTAIFMILSLSWLFGSDE